LNAVLTGSVAVVALLAGLRCARLVVGLAAPRRLAFLARVEACSGAVTLASWLVAGAMFLVLFAPFNASRHALLLVPPLFLLAYQEAVRDSVAPRSVTARPWLVLYAAAALYVAACDWEMARFYRAAAPVASERALRIAGEGAVIYFRGHWGWQWYARRTGMREFDLARSDLAVGDVLVDPVGVHAQRLPPGAAFETADIVREDTGPLSVFDTLPLYIVLRGAEPNLAPRPPRVIRILRRVM
jgi:hypothetical protein